MTYQPPNTVDLDVTNHGQLIEMAMGLGIEPGDTVMFDNSGGLNIWTGCSPDAALTTFVGYKALLVKKGFAWATVSRVAVDETHSAMAVATSAL